jgi:hypothetical protein
MSGLGQIPTDYKKYLDQTLRFYLPSKKTAMDLFNIIKTDSGQTTLEYVKKTQTYAAAKGWTSFSDPGGLADGARPTIDGLGTEDATSTATRFGTGYRLNRALLTSGVQIIQQYITQHAIENVEIVRNYVNRTLITNMASNASQTYTATGGTWTTTGDPADDVITAQATFKQQSGGVEADFLLLHPNEYGDIKKDERFQSTLYTGKSLESGTIVPKPFGLDVIEDQAVTTGSFFLGKKGMFADLYVLEDYATYETDEGAAGKTYEIAHKWVDQYKLPYYLMYGTGI